MNWLQNMKIGTRLALSFGLILIIFGSSAGFAIYSLSQIMREMDAISGEDYEVELAQRIRIEVNQVFLHMSYVILSTDADKQESYLQELNAVRTQYANDMKEIKAVTADEPESIRMLTEIEETLGTARGFNDQAIALAQAGKQDQAFSLFSSKSLPEAEKLDQYVNNYLQYTQTQKDSIFKAATALQKNTIYILVISGALSLVLAIFVIALTTRGIVQPVGTATSLLGKISTGDLTVSLQSHELSRQDEMGVMNRSMSQVIENMRGSLGQIQSSMQMLASASTELSSISEEMTAGAGESSSKANAVAAAAQELNANTLSVAAGVEQATNNLASVATATEEMTATIGEIAGNSEKARATTVEAARQADSISLVMKELGQAAQEIGKVTETITSISAQTNLLALNATIEAARAGAAGKGFAVVANEIKELAQQTAAATGEIKGRIASIQSSTNGAVTDIERIVRVIKEVNDIVNAIATAIEEQSVVTRDIAGNIAQASSGVKDANRRIAQTATVSGDIAQDIASVSMNASQMASASQQVQSSAGELSQLAENLRQMVSQYKIKAA